MICRETTIRVCRSLILSSIILMIGVKTVSAQTGPIVDSPRPGAVLQGIVEIRGTSEVKGFRTSEISFSYANDQTDTWFIISSDDKGVDLGFLTKWDTSLITDGNYDLRLRVYLDDGSYFDAFVHDLRVRNYTSIETPTPIPDRVISNLAPTTTSTKTPFPTPTDLARNPAVLTSGSITNSAIIGASGTLILLAIFGLYRRLRRN